MPSLITFEPNKYFHIYNHAVGVENLYRNEENYLYFLRKYAEHIEPIAKTFAYILMPNHFHFAIQIRDESVILELMKKKENIDLGEINYSKFLMQQFSNLFNGYTKAYNKMFVRKGALFNDFLKRIEISESQYFLNLIHYIHWNAVHHGFCKHPSDWSYSSFHSLIVSKKTLLQRNTILDWFGGIEEFIEFHTGRVQYEQSIIIE
jgi:putative transposase